MKSALRTAGLLGGAALGALLPAGPAAATGLARLAAATTADLYVAVVIDFGGAKGAPQNIATCVKVPQGDTDTDALVAAVGQSNLAYAPSGLLCGIDSIPANAIANCNAASDGEYYFWSYWNGKNGSWSYAQAGPSSTLATPGDVEGWRYQDPGPASSSAPTPGVAPNFSQFCPAEYASTQSPTTTTPTTVPGASHGSQTAPTTPSSSVSTTPRNPAAPSVGAHTSTPVTNAPASSRHTSTSTTPTSSPRTNRGPPDTSPATSGHGSVRALGPLRHTNSPGADWLVPLLVGLLVIGLGIAAAVRWRRRPTSS